MAGVLYGWRFRVLLTVTIVVPIAVMTLSAHPDFAGEAAALEGSLDGIEAPTAEEKTTLRNQIVIQKGGTTSMFRTGLAWLHSPWPFRPFSSNP